MRGLVPPRDERHRLHVQVGQVGDVGRHHEPALEDRERLLHVIHLGAVDGREVHLEARMALQPEARPLAMVRRDSGNLHSYTRSRVRFFGAKGIPRGDSEGTPRFSLFSRGLVMAR